ncbi:hypothetical protein [Tropicimonas sp.]|uniref:hypothetical protein n=1 Tax=Tropicimonas sp. TaxID=2067044 RepID=UPI003A8C7F32
MRTILPSLMLCIALGPGACTSWNDEAGAGLDQGDFGSATLRNRTEMTCRPVAQKNTGKYGTPLSANCPGRRQDGKYAHFSYLETVRSATETPSSSLLQNEITSN